MRFPMIVLVLVLVPFAAFADDGATQITFDAVSAHSPAWSPDGSHIAFSHSGTAIALVPTTGGAVTLIPGSEGNDVDHPTWSPNGDEIAFSADLLLNVELIYAVPTTGGTARPMTGCGFGCSNTYHLCPNWSPDGELVVCYWRQLTMGGLVESIITFPAHEVGGGGTVCSSNDGMELCGVDPCWSPDMTQIAFESLWPGSNSNIWVIPATGGTATQLTTDDGYDSQPAWSPDGRIAFCSDRTGAWEIWVIPATGGTERQVTDHPGSDAAPAWSPDGSRIAFSSDRSGTQHQIWVIETPPVSIDGDSWGGIKSKYKVR